MSNIVSSTQTNSKGYSTFTEAWNAPIPESSQAFKKFRDLSTCYFGVGGGVWLLCYGLSNSKKTPRPGVLGLPIITGVFTYMAIEKARELSYNTARVIKTAGHKATDCCKRTIMT